MLAVVRFVLFCQSLTIVATITQTYITAWTKAKFYKVDDSYNTTKLVENSKLTLLLPCPHAFQQSIIIIMDVIVLKMTLQYGCCLQPQQSATGEISCNITGGNVFAAQACSIAPKSDCTLLNLLL